MLKTRSLHIAETDRDIESHESVREVYPREFVSCLRSSLVSLGSVIPALGMNGIDVCEL